MAKKDTAQSVMEMESTEEDHAPLLDTARLKADAQALFDKMSANPEHRGDPALTYAAHVLDLLNGLEQAVSDALRSESDVRLANVDRIGIGQIARRHLLAAKVNAGVYDVTDPAPEPDPLPAE